MSGAKLPESFDQRSQGWNPPIENQDVSTIDVATMKQQGVSNIGIATLTDPSKIVFSTPGFSFVQGNAVKSAITDSSNPLYKSFKLGAFEEAFTVTQSGSGWVDAKNSTMECCGATTSHFIIVGVVETAISSGLAHTAVLKAAEDAMNNGG